MFISEELIISDLPVFEKIADIIRCVDPVRKEVLEYKNRRVKSSAFHCYDFWDRNAVCANCISMRAYNENAVFVKIEYGNGRIHMVTAVPYDLENRRIVIELLKDTTDGMILGAGKGGAAAADEVRALIDNMNQLAYTDALTGVYNRRYIGEKLPVDLLNSSLLSKDVSVIMADIDHFKSINDTYGHLAGDCALKSFAGILSGCLKRSSDWIARFGGEEFLICMPGADRETAASAAELMRRTVESRRFECEDAAFHMTASFGVWSLLPKGGETADELLRNADKKLYLAKENGRNRVEA